MATAYSTSREVTARPLYASRLPFDERRVGAAAVYCSDGRFGEQMDEFLHEQLRLPRYDPLPSRAGLLVWPGTRCSTTSARRWSGSCDFSSTLTDCAAWC